MPPRAERSSSLFACTVRPNTTSRPVGTLILRNLWRSYHGAWENVLFVNGTFQWGAHIATLLSILSIVPRHCARLTDFLHPKSRKLYAVLITSQLIALTLRRLRRFIRLPKFPVFG